ncbi:nucleolar complex protein 4 homolog isoform X2 [Littorina saxatilis]|uniref:nucleolar complex protein 4 homolog isoform X2 n=1 Tax=Littorina saxatilis TaxID=31220 RepID=UPI0038B51643
MTKKEDDASVAIVAVRALQQIFARLLSVGEMVIDTMPDKEEDLTKGEKVSVWLREQYKTACDALVEKLDNADAKLQEASLVALLKFVEQEGQRPLDKPAAGQLSFPYTLLQSVVEKLLSKTDNMEALILRLSEVMEHDDVRFFLMKAIKQELGKTPTKDRNEVFLSNVLCALENLEFPESDGSEPLTKFLAVSDDNVSQPKLSSLAEQKKSFTACWMEFLRSELTSGLYRRVLTKLDEKVVPFLSSPLVLADFLTQSYDVGGAISLLALNGIFILIHRYNLDYPDFYKKFYTLFEPQIFQAKYKARFFHLADLFLSSTHLPSYLVASFVKRIARLALSAPPAGARLCVVFVYNLMVRHPSCAVLAHHPDYTCNTDPFLMEEQDPAKTKAMDSSLWEIKTLQSHFSPEVAQEAMKINHPVTQEQKLADFLEVSTEQMMEHAMKKKPTQEVPINHEKPKGLFDKNIQRFFTLV